MKKFLNFIGVLLTFIFLVLIVYFFFCYVKYNLIKKEHIELFVSHKMFLFLATTLYAICALLNVYIGFVMMTEYKFKGIFVILAQVLFLFALIYMYIILV